MLKFCSLLGKLCCNKEKLLDIIRTLKQIISLKLTRLVCKVILKKEKKKKGLFAKWMWVQGFIKNFPKISILYYSNYFIYLYMEKVWQQN